MGGKRFRECDDPPRERGQLSSHTRIYLLEHGYDDREHECHDSRRHGEDDDGIAHGRGDHVPLRGPLAVVVAQEVECPGQTSRLVADAHHAALQGAECPASAHGLGERLSAHDGGVEPFEQRLRPAVALALDEQSEGRREIETGRQQCMQLGVEHLASGVRQFMALRIHDPFRFQRFFVRSFPVRAAARGV